MLEEIKLFLGTKLAKEKFNFENIYKFVDFQKKEKLYPEHRVIDSSPAAAEVIVNGKNVIMLSSNNYLGLSGEPGVVAAASEAIKIFGIGPGTSRLLSGNIRVYEDRIVRCLRNQNLREPVEVNIRSANVCHWGCDGIVRHEPVFSG